MGPLLARVRGPLVAAAVLAVVASLSTAAVSVRAERAARADDLAGLVSEQPTTGWPVVLGTPRYVNEDDPFGLGVELEREVFAAVEVGDLVVVGGNFHEIETVDGTVISQRHLAAFDRVTGVLDPAFGLDVDGEVRSLHASADGTHLYVGGRFSTIDGVNVPRLARVEVATGSVDAAFAPIPSASIETIDVTDGGRLFVGGPFDDIDGTGIGDVAELDPVSGVPLPAFDFDFEGVAARGTFADFSQGEVKHVEATAAGDRLVVVHRAATVDGQTRSGYAIFDISDPTEPELTPDHSNTFFEWPNCAGGALPTSGAISPDGTFLVMGTTVFDLPACHDAVLAFPIGGGPDAPARWAHQMRDSVFSVAVSDAAVYAGGHFCRIDEGPGATMTAGRDDIFCTGANPAKYPDGAWRWQLAALHPDDGTPLDWDPGADAVRGPSMLQVTDRGLLVGFDGGEVNGVRTGSLAFLALEPADPPADPPVEDPVDPPEDPPIEDPVDPPAPVICNGLEATIVGTETDDILEGTAAADVIAGLGGNDVIHGLGGDDVICGGPGNDRIWAGGGDDVVYGDDGNDRLRGELGHDTMFGGIGRDAVIGGSGDDILEGGTGDDRVVGGAGADIGRGGNGRDRVLGRGGVDDLRGGGGDDDLSGGGGADALNGGGGLDRCVMGGETVRRCEVFV